MWVLYPEGSGKQPEGYQPHLQQAMVGLNCTMMHSNNRVAMAAMYPIHVPWLPRVYGYCTLWQHLDPSHIMVQDMYTAICVSILHSQTMLRHSTDSMKD